MFERSSQIIYEPSNGDWSVTILPRAPSIRQAVGVMCELIVWGVCLVAGICAVTSSRGMPFKDNMVTVENVISAWAFLVIGLCGLLVFSYATFWRFSVFERVIVTKSHIIISHWVGQRKWNKEIPRDGVGHVQVIRPTKRHPRCCSLNGWDLVCLSPNAWVISFERKRETLFWGLWLNADQAAEICARFEEALNRKQSKSS